MTKATNNKIGNMIRSARLAKGMTQEELAAKVGVTKAIISKYELGQIVNYSRPRIQALAKALEISPLLFVGFEPAPEDGALIYDAARGAENKSKAGAWKIDPIEPNSAKQDDVQKIDVLRNIYYKEPAGAREPTPEERELTRIYKKLSVKKRLQLLTLAYQLEEETEQLDSARIKAEAAKLSE